MQRYVGDLSEANEGTVQFPPVRRLSVTGAPVLLIGTARYERGSELPAVSLTCRIDGKHPRDVASLLKKPFEEICLELGLAKRITPRALRRPSTTSPAPPRSTTSSPEASAGTSRRRCNPGADVGDPGAKRKGRLSSSLKPAILPTIYELLCITHYGVGAIGFEPTTPTVSR